MARTNSNILVVPKFKQAFLSSHQKDLSPQARLISFIGALFLLSMLIGVIWSTFSNSVLSNYLSYLSSTNVTDRVSSSFAAIILKTAFPQLSLILLCCIFANSAVGIPFLITIVLFRGFFAGVFGACTVKALLFKGFLANLITFSPSLVLSAFALISVCANGVRASISVNSVINRGKSRNTKDIFEQFYHSVAISLIISVSGCVLEAVLIRNFGSLLI